jgi:hypothetical protein
MSRKQQEPQQHFPALAGHNREWLRDAYHQLMHAQAQVALFHTQPELAKHAQDQIKGIAQRVLDLWSRADTRHQLLSYSAKAGWRVRRWRAANGLPHPYARRK